MVINNLTLNEIKQGYRQYLESNGFSRLTIQTSCTDAFYLLRHDSSLDFWGLFECQDFEETAYNHLKRILTEKSNGNIGANINGYMLHLRKLKSYLGGKDVDTKVIANISETIKTVPQKAKITRDDVPTPTADEVEKYLRAWDELENYALQENALNKLFFEHCPKNESIEDVLIKASTLNDFYSTNIYSIYPVAKHIFNLKIDDRMKAGDPTLVDDIKKITISGKEKNFYSFATKYCSHHNPLEYPIYDSYVDEVLRYLRDRDQFSSFRSDELKEYSQFKNILIDFRNYYALTQYNLKEIDKYLWQFGKEHFPKYYGKAKK